MRWIVCACFDRGAACYMSPFSVSAVGVAIRNFTDQVNREAEDNVLYKHPQDFEVHHLGYFDDNSGRYENVGNAPEFVVSGSSVKEVRNG